MNGIATFTPFIGEYGSEIEVCLYLKIDVPQPDIQLVEGIDEL
jgi:hypothetical protein